MSRSRFKQGSAVRSGLAEKAPARTLWEETQQEAGPSTGSALPFSAESVGVQAEERHGNDAVLSPETGREGLRVELDDEDRNVVWEQEQAKKATTRRS